MQTDQASQVVPAMVLLAEIVKDFQETGRHANAAALKPELQRRTYGAFYEAKLGFQSFRQFLQAAQSKGFIALREASGRDLEAVLPGNAVPQISPATVDRSQRQYVRPDLWRAFMDWNPGWKRLYKLTTSQVFSFPEVPGPLGDPRPEYEAFRSEWRKSPEAFREIIPIPKDTQFAWMSEFAAGLSNEPVKKALAAALTTPKPFGAFSRLIFGLPEGEQWRRYRLERVVNAIRKWSADNNLDLLPFSEDERTPRVETVASTPQAARREGVPSVSHGANEEEVLKRRVIVALEKMPLAELLRLAIPIEYLIEH